MKAASPVHEIRVNVVELMTIGMIPLSLFGGEGAGVMATAGALLVDGIMASPVAVDEAAVGAG